MFREEEEECGQTDATDIFSTLRPTSVVRKWILEEKKRMGQDGQYMYKNFKGAFSLVNSVASLFGLSTFILININIKKLGQLERDVVSKCKCALNSYAFVKQTTKAKTCETYGERKNDDIYEGFFCCWLDILSSI